MYYNYREVTVELKRKLIILTIVFEVLASSTVKLTVQETQIRDYVIFCTGDELVENGNV